MPFPLLQHLNHTQLEHLNSQHFPPVRCHPDPTNPHQQTHILTHTHTQLELALAAERAAAGEARETAVAADAASQRARDDAREARAAAAEALQQLGALQREVVGLREAWEVRGAELAALQDALNAERDEVCIHIHVMYDNVRVHAVW